MTRLNRRLDAAMLAVTLFLVACFVVPPPAQSGQPEAVPTAANPPGTPPGYTVRNITGGNQTIKLSGANRLWLKGDGSLRSGKKTVNGIQMEGCSNVLVTDLQFSGWYCGIKCNNSNNIEFRGVTCTKNFQQGFLFTNGKQITLKSCEGSKTGGSSKSQHGIYFGCWQNGYTEDLLVEDSSFYGSALAEAQVNSETASRAAKGVVFRRVKVTNSKFAVNALGVTSWLMENCAIQSNVKAFSLAKPYGRSWSSTVTLRNSPSQGREVVQQGSKLIKE